MQFEKLSLLEIVDLLKNGKVTSQELTKYFIDKTEEKKDLNAIIEVFSDAMQNAKIADEKLKNGENGKLLGVPVVIKDNILYKGKIASCGSKFLENYVAQYNSTVVEKLLAEGAVIFARANMDEFAMGSSTETSYYGITHNALDYDRVPGGSSGGSAAAVAGGLCPVSLGTDTGGSVRQPCSYNGLVGIKPTYGRISRFGVIAFASSIEQVGPMTKTVKDNAYMLEILSGHSEHDETSSLAPVENYLSQITGSIKGLKIGICKEIMSAIKDTEVEKPFSEVLDYLKSQGVEFVDVSIPDYDLSLPCYYIIAPAEATSNLGRFDGVKYSRRSEKAKNVDEIYIKSRSEGFGAEVKRRIMLGNFVLSSGYFDAYYNKAKKLQLKLKKETAEVFKKCDILISPTTAGIAFKLGEKNGDPISMYKEDLFTIISNIAGIPALTLPFAKGKNGLPLGLQIMANNFEEGKIYNLADYIETNRR